MAYLDLAEPQVRSTPKAKEAARVAAAQAPAAFSGLEWSVIGLARRDSLATLRTPSRIATALGSLFGGGSNPRLADGRLEALRRMAVLAWHKGWMVPVSELRVFKNAGFSLDHYELLQRSVGRGKEVAGQG